MGARLIFYAIVAALAAVTIYGVWKSIWNAGWKARDADFQSYIKNQKVKTVEVVREVEKVVVQVEKEVVEKIREVRIKGDTIVKEVPIYVDKTDDAACELRAGFVRIHDAAARNASPEPARESDRDPAGVALSEAAAVIADNYTKYHACREQVIGWNKFWAKYSAQLRDSVCVADATR